NPDPDAPDGPQVPPTEDGPGNWELRHKSSQLIERDDYGKLADVQSGTEYGGVAPKVGTLARVTFDNFDDPTTDWQPQPPSPGPVKPWQVNYYDRFYFGTPRVPQQY